MTAFGSFFCYLFYLFFSLFFCFFFLWFFGSLVLWFFGSCFFGEIVVFLMVAFYDGDDGGLLLKRLVY